MEKQIAFIYIAFAAMSGLTLASGLWILPIVRGWGSALLGLSLACSLLTIVLALHK